MTKFSSLLLIAVLGFCVYVNSLQNGFVLDETFVIEGNTFITSWANLKDFFNGNYFGRYSEDSYRPVTTLSYFVDYHFWGYKPFGYHLTNLIFHILNGILLFTLLSFLWNDKHKTRDGAGREISGIFTVPLLAALLFVTHPVNTEAVNSAGFREEPLFVFFFMASLILYVHSRGLSPAKKTTFYPAGIPQGLRYKTATAATLYIISLLLYLLADLTKEAAVILPLFIVLIDICYPGDSQGDVDNRHRMLFYAGYMATGILYMLIRFVWMTNSGTKGLFYPEVTYLGGSLYASLLTTVRIFAGYVRLLFFPHPLYIERRFMEISYSVMDLKVLSALAFFGALFIIIVWSFRRSKEIPFAMAWIFIPLLPVANIIPIYTPMAERYLYLSSMGFSIFISWLLVKAININRKAMTVIGAVISVCLIAAYSVKTIKQNYYWQDNYVFCTQMLKHAPDSFMLHNNMGNSFYKQGRCNQAIEEYRKAQELLPNFYSYYNMGNVYVTLGDYQKAMLSYKKAIRQQSTVDNKAYLAQAYNNLGFLLWKSGDYIESKKNYETAQGLFTEQGHLKKAQAIRMFLNGKK